MISVVRVLRPAGQDGPGVGDPELPEGAYDAVSYEISSAIAGTEDAQHLRVWVSTPIVQEAIVRVLVADDDATSRHMLELILGRLGYEVVETVNGENAWAALNDVDPPELAVLDWMMPKTSGDDLCRMLRSRPNAAPLYIIMLTAKSGKDDIVKALGAGADDYIVKPFNVNELHARIKRGERVLALQHELIAARREIQSLKAAIPPPLPRATLPSLVRAIPLGAGAVAR
jgi:PleD family two-component response regulator